MIQKIKGHAPKTNVYEICNREAIGGYMNMFGIYFNSVGNCIMDIDLTGQINTALVYCKVNKFTSCGECHANCMEIEDKWNFGPADPIWEHVHVNQEKPDFMRVEVVDYVRKLCDDSLVLSIRNSNYNRVVGEFCPSKKILITTDWTHDDSRFHFVSDVLTQMYTVGWISIKTIEKKKPIITLGADPEFEYIDTDTGQILNCKDMGIQDRLLMGAGMQGRIGIDGSGCQRELRPEPSDSPEGLIENIEKLIQAGLDEKWSLKGEKFSLGGHIHIGGVEESKDFGKLLDYYLGPLDVLNSMVRRNSGYGKLGSSDNVRRQDHGMEYRAPPVGWLASKELARITLKIVKFAAEKHFYGEDIDLTDNLSTDLETLGINKDEIATFFQEIEKYKNEGLPGDLKEAWGYKTPPKFVLEFRDVWSSGAKKYLEDIVRKMAAKEELGGRCVFYGLAADRGNVFSVVMSHMNGIEMPETYGFMPPLKTGAGKNHVGIPCEIRNNLSEVKKMEDTILEIVKRTINPPTQKKPRKKTVVRIVPVGEPVAHVIREGMFPEYRTEYETTGF